MTSIADRSMGLGLKALGGLAQLEALDRLGLREPIQRLVRETSKHGFRTATTAGRAFGATTKLARPARQKPVSSSGLFDLTPTEEQQMLQEAFGEFADALVRPAARDADAENRVSDELLAQATELGAAMLGVPEELGGAMAERSAVTSVLVAEQLGRGDLGIGAALLGPASVATLISLYGDAEQQSRYLEPFTGDDPPVAAFALLEPAAAFDPFDLATTAVASGGGGTGNGAGPGGYTLTGTKSLVLRAADAELFVVAASIDGTPALFVVEPGAEGLSTSAEPAMGLRPGATATLHLEGVSAQRLTQGEADYADAVHRARLAWCALSVGTAQAVLDYVIPQVNDRTAFGEPVSHRQAVAFMVADISIELESMRLTTYRAAARADAGKDFHREAAIARRLCGEKGMWIGSAGVQLLGGHGYVKEHPVERWYRDLRAVGLVEGGLVV